VGVGIIVGVAVGSCPGVFVGVGSPAGVLVAVAVAVGVGVELEPGKTKQVSGVPTP
jgi:hypothetical protein